MNAAARALGWLGSPSRLGPVAGSIREGVLRLVAAALQILATIVIVRSLEPAIVGIFLRGVVIAAALAALLRYRYELFIAPYIAGHDRARLGVPVDALLVELNQRFLIRCALVCGVLLVVTSDLDVLEPHRFPFLQTYLPFVLAIPFIGLAQMLGSALRAAERTLLSMVCSAYTVNTAILCTAAVALPSAPLDLLAWAFFAGCIVAALLACLFAWLVFRTPAVDGSVGAIAAGTDRVSTGAGDALAGAGDVRTGAWWQVHESVAANSAIAIALAFTLWGPSVIVAVLASAEEMARYGVALRTAQIMDFLLPALTFVLCAERPILRRTVEESGQRPRLRQSLATAAVASSVTLVVLLLATPRTLALYGDPYRDLVVVYVVLLSAHWINGAGRPAVRFLVANWNASAIRRTLEAAAVAATLTTAAGVAWNAPLAAAVATLLAALIVNTLAAAAASKGPRPSRSLERPPP